MPDGLAVYAHVSAIQDDATKLYSRYATHGASEALCGEIVAFRQRVAASGFVDLSHSLCDYLERLACYDGVLIMEECFKIASLVDTIFILDKLGLAMSPEDAVRLRLAVRTVWKKDKKAMSLAVTGTKNDWNTWWRELLEQKI